MHQVWTPSGRRSFENRLCSIRRRLLAKCNLYRAPARSWSLSPCLAVPGDTCAKANITTHVPYAMRILGWVGETTATLARVFDHAPRCTAEQRIIVEMNGRDVVRAASRLDDMHVYVLWVGALGIMSRSDRDELVVIEGVGHRPTAQLPVPPSRVALGARTEPAGEVEEARPSADVRDLARTVQGR